jgi:hypothetical protein
MGCGAGAFGDLADDPAACLAGDPGLDLTNAEVGRDGKCLDFAHDPLRDGRAAEVFSACFGGSMPAVTRSLISDDSSSATAPMMVNIALPMGLSVST